MLVNDSNSLTREASESTGMYCCITSRKDRNRWRRMRQIFITLDNLYTRLNLFETPGAQLAPEDLQNQLISTKIFIITFFFSFCILLVYTATGTTVKTVVITSPTFQQYEKLYQKHAATLICPCSRLATEYETFIHINYSLHPVCSSYYVTDAWIGDSFQSGTLYVDDFRLLGRRIFQALRSMCSLADESIQISLDQFTSTKYISMTLVPDDLLHSQADTFIRQFITSVSNHFLLSVRLIGNTTQANALASALFSQGYFIKHLDVNTLYFIPATYGDCDCSSRSDCSSNSPIYINNTADQVWYVPGIFVGCFVMEALRRSDLRCLFDQTCLDDLQRSLQKTTTLSPLSIPSESSGSFGPTTPMGEAIDDVMVEKWNWSVSHAQYFEKCRPEQCTYTLVVPNGLLTIVTSLFGLLGGLVAGLKLVIPRLVWFIRLQLNRRTTPHANTPLIRRYCIELNLFPSSPPANNPFDLHTQRIATRIFIVTFLISFSVLLIYTATDTTLHTFTISTPSLAQYQHLYQYQPQSLSCPCSQLAISYQSFIHINYSLHPVCSSYFVSDAWIDGGFPITAPYDTDFRLIGGRLFQALRSMCNLADESIKISLDQFDTTHYVSGKLVADDALRSEADALVEQFIRSSTNNFLLSLRLIGNTTQANALLSGLATNFYLDLPESSNLVRAVSKRFDGCSCARRSSCTSLAEIYVNDSLSEPWLVPGCFIGCFVMEALRRSDLRCFFNQTCLDDLQPYLDHDFMLTAMSHVSDPSRLFVPTTPIGTVMDAWMVDRWDWSVSFEQYFQECRPQQCSFFRIIRNGPITIVTVLFGLIGGLMTGLKLAIPRFTMLLRSKFQQQRVPIPDQAFRHHFGILPTLIRRYCIELNLFPSSPSTNNPFDLHTQRIATRIFIVTFLISFSVLLIYTATDTTLHTFTISTPSLAQYQHLYQYQPQSLSCPCSQPAISYQSFIHINYSLHPVCSSYYVSDPWIDGGFPITAPYDTDFRLIGGRLFQALRSMCNLADESIKISLDQFDTTHYISGKLVADDVLRSEADALVEQFIRSSTNNFLLSLRLIGNTTHANAMVSALFTNYVFRVRSGTNVASSGRKGYDGCSCDLKSDCTSNGLVYMNDSSTQSWMVPGFYVGCFVMEALRRSDLRCLFDQTCLDDLQRSLQKTTTLSPISIPSDSSGSFDLTTPMGDVIDDLMVEKWNWSVSHAQYFGKCRPEQCTYTLVVPNGLLAIVTSLIGMLGGLVTVERWLVHRSVSLVARWIRENRTRIIHPIDNDTMEIPETPRTANLIP